MGIRSVTTFSILTKPNQSPPKALTLPHAFNYPTSSLHPSLPSLAFLITFVNTLCFNIHGK